jgi:hypothetical protein
VSQQIDQLVSQLGPAWDVDELEDIAEVSAQLPQERLAPVAIGADQNPENQDRAQGLPGMAQQRGDEDPLPLSARHTATGGSEGHPALENELELHLQMLVKRRNRAAGDPPGSNVDMMARKSDPRQLQSGQPLPRVS